MLVKPKVSLHLPGGQISQGGGSVPRPSLVTRGLAEEDFHVELEAEAKPNRVKF